MNAALLTGAKTDRSPRFRELDGGRKVCDFTIVTAGPTAFIDVTAWDELAELAQDLKPGDFVFVDGKLRSESWEKDGQKFFRLKVVATTLRRLVSNSQSDDAGTAVDSATDKVEK